MFQTTRRAEQTLREVTDGLFFTMSDKFTLRSHRQTDKSAGGVLAYRKLWTVSRTFGVEGDEAVAQRPLLHRLFQDHLLREDDHVDVVEPAEALQDLGHGLGFGLLGHGADAHHNLSLWRLVEEENILISKGKGTHCKC